MREVDQLLRVIFSGRRKTGRLDLEAIEMVVRSALHQAGAFRLASVIIVSCSLWKTTPYASLASAIVPRPTDDESTGFIYGNRRTREALFSDGSHSGTKVPMQLPLWGGLSPLCRRASAVFGPVLGSRQQPADVALEAISPWSPGGYSG